MAMIMERSRPGTLELFEGLDFRLPPDLEAAEPPEARGLARDAVRLMVSYRGSSDIHHTAFRQLPDLLDPGDVLVVNTSGTMSAALPAKRPDGSEVRLHLSTRLPGDLWTVEVRAIEGETTRPIGNSISAETLSLPGEAFAVLHAPYRCGCGGLDEPHDTRLWMASLHLPMPLLPYLDRFGSPIRYGYVKDEWPISYYQTVYATETGSAEMPSAGRAFTAEMFPHLVARGIQVAPLLLHTGVASLEAHEPPYEEFYRVPLETARLINGARNVGRRVVAVGTTVVRALESVVDDEGSVHPGEGWTCVIVTPERGIRSVNALLTGLHEPRSTHLMMLEALAGRPHLRLAYAEALAAGYLWHEFGDLHLILP